ncbi:hypothetical protein CAOG_05876 [Capsaspora owczarzaki ATCC 30864]|uniref:UBR-type domain-containing protein n=1 Tax=Capsaspora owczarzaki (strain ATCC 30864) TaxID=595528 RepID=A0A0D2UJZ0_CAPO3|nr:hypothetical protein CAOG_05876 [Capsaspora owczarzaki ATCC 30864]KJE95421.1 hypothetical protein CAOG_005876 [Capsaspora owczarzaki ATCC 30864]|eukprot:XP_004345466.1 hypothetical protein CAOG_05876 [Capsaspora owczarzaki ATCC 30864]
MLNGRSKQGPAEFDWRAMALGKKHQRKSIGFGAYDKKNKSHAHEIHIRELCVATGALGCALWDGGVVLARWIYENGAAFRGQTVLELGSGCGLPGVLAAHYAAHVTLTDYIDPVLDNLRYNVRLNSEDADADRGVDAEAAATSTTTSATRTGLDGDQPSSSSPPSSDPQEKTTNADPENTSASWAPVADSVTGEMQPWRRNLTPLVTVGYLDWDAVAAASASLAGLSLEERRKCALENEKAQRAEQEQRKLEHTKGLRCTIESLGREFTPQDWYHCTDCHGSDMTLGCCASCVKVCHAQHNTKFVEHSRFKCDCYSSEACVFEQQSHAQGINLHIEPVDVIIGAELTYSLLSVDSLIQVVDTFLKPDGVFYEVLSEDRDGVSEFVDRIQKRGFIVKSVPVPARFMGNYATRQWTYQDTETYRFFSFHRPGSKHRDMQ